MKSFKVSNSLLDSEKVRNYVAINKVINFDP
jgi:hypothetical protein